MAQTNKLKALFWITGLALLVFQACAPRPGWKALEEQARAADIERLAAQLTGDNQRDQARINLLDPARYTAMRLAGGWLLDVRDTDARRLWWMDHRQTGGRLVFLAKADSLRLLDQLEDEQNAGPDGDTRLLFVRVTGSLAELGELKLDGSWKQRYEGLVGTWRIRNSDKLSLLKADDSKNGLFRESSGSWRLENERHILRQEGEWYLEKPHPLDSPYRCLGQFIYHARKGHWRRARALADPTRLFSPPDRGPVDFKASLKASLPKLLDRKLELKAPPLGDFSYFEDISGSYRWRVDFEQGRDGWRIIRLERVLKP
jgi:hypothetical protein